MALPPAPSGRRRLVGVSTKMYFDLPTTLAYADAVAARIPAAHAQLQFATDIFIIPDFVTLCAVRARVAPLWVGGQDAFSQDKGAFTGEVSPLVLKQAGATLVELGHAERRRFFGETDAQVVDKALAALKVGLTPLICVGEVDKVDLSVAAQKDAAVQAVWAQVAGVFAAADQQDAHEVILAYEPVWAIGASQPASPEYVVQITQALRALAAPHLRANGGKFTSIRILYGGSAGPGTFRQIQDGVDGLFLGRFAHDPERFIQTILEVGS